MTGVIVGIVILAIIIILALVLVGMYNSLVKLRNLVQEAWAQIDVELKRRHDLIGNLVETVKGYAAHESGTFEAITQARANAMTPGQGPAEAAKSEAALTQALVSLNAVAEAYPDLKANQNFMSLQSELSSTEDRIASARRYYNANVRELNTKVDTVPTNVIAGIASVGKAEYFEAESTERQAPQVSFGAGGSTPAPAAPVAPAPSVMPVPPLTPQDSAAPVTPAAAPAPPASPQA
ncbi:MAG: LemA family protein [Lapillicoccus sp.]